MSHTVKRSGKTVRSRLVLQGFIEGFADLRIDANHLSEGSFAVYGERDERIQCR
jgi:hypothetical protein